MNVIQILIAAETEYHYVYKQPFHYQWQWVIPALVLLGLAYYIFTRWRSLYRFKLQCTFEVPAVITALRKSRSVDGTFGGRGTHYNADYRYEYEGRVYESRTFVYGQKQFHTPKIGDVTMIRIDPYAPENLFDPFAESALQFYLCTSICMAAAAAMLLFEPMFMQLF